MDAESFRIGNYKHYKGDLYTALMLVTHHETRQPMVLYVSHKTGELNVRPLKPMPGDPDGWDDWVQHDGNEVRRFSYLGSGRTESS